MSPTRQNIMLGALFVAIIATVSFCGGALPETEPSLSVPPTENDGG